MTPFRAALSILVTAASLAACTVAPAATRPHPAGGDLVTAEQIQRSGARTAWQVLERRPGLLRTGTGVGGRTFRSNPGAPGSGTPLLIVDGVRMVDLDVLRSIPAESIRSIELLNSVDAPTYPGAAHGVIIVRTAPRAAP